MMQVVVSSQAAQPQPTTHSHNPLQNSGFHRAKPEAEAGSSEDVSIYTHLSLKHTTSHWTVALCAAAMDIGTETGQSSQPGPQEDRIRGVTGSRPTEPIRGEEKLTCEEETACCIRRMK